MTRAGVKAFEAANGEKDISVQNEGLFTRATRLALRFVLGGIQRLRRRIWYFTRPKTFGAHAAAITPHGTLILVKLRYAPGWRLPGGGRRPDEDPEQAVLRELREEIGMTGHGSVQLASEMLESPDYKQDLASLFIVRDVEYRPRWSLEIEAVQEAALDALPPDTSLRTLGWLAAMRPMLVR